MSASLGAPTPRPMAFFLRCWDYARDGRDVEASDVQDWGEEFGLLAKVVETAPCGDGCWCEEYYGEFPVDCYRPIEGVPTPAMIAAAPPLDLAAVEAQMRWCQDFCATGALPFGPSYGNVDPAVSTELGMLRALIETTAHLLAALRATRAALEETTRGFELGEFENAMHGDVVITGAAWQRLHASWERAAAVLARVTEGPCT